MEEHLVAVEIDGTATDLAADDRQLRGGAEVLVDLAGDLLMDADADIGIERIDQRQDGLSPGRNASARP
jgi:hypothetical protein